MEAITFKQLSGRSYSVRRIIRPAMWLLCALCLLPLANAYGQEKPRVTVIATGGTIAGEASSAVQAGYSPAQRSVEALLQQVPQLSQTAHVNGIQLCNIASQAMTPAVWIDLAVLIDSLFTHNLCDGVVVTHGTDTMEETAYFLTLTLPHANPVVLVGAMRPATGLSADGPLNLYNAVCVAAHPDGRGKGVMVLMNDRLFSADDVTKTQSVNPDAFECPNYGPLGIVRGGVPSFFRTPQTRHTTRSRFAIGALCAQWRQAARERDGLGRTRSDALAQASQKETLTLGGLLAPYLPPVPIVASYAGADAVALKAYLASGAAGVVIEGVGHGNMAPVMEQALESAYVKGIPVVRATRVKGGGVTTALEGFHAGQIPAGYKTPQKARILLMLALVQTHSLAEIERIFSEY